MCIDDPMNSDGSTGLSIIDVPLLVVVRTTIVSTKSIPDMYSVGIMIMI